MKAKIFIIFFIIGILTLQTLAIVKIVKENRRLSDNFHSALSGIQFSMTRDSLQTAKTEKMLLEASEIKAYFPEITKSIERLDVKMRQLERYSAVSSTASYDIATRLRDTVQIKETVIRQQFRYKKVPLTFSSLSQL